jgi:hypothetical protein
MPCWRCQLRNGCGSKRPPWAEGIRVPFESITCPECQADKDFVQVEPDTFYCPYHKGLFKHVDPTGQLGGAALCPCGIIARSRCNKCAKPVCASCDLGYNHFGLGCMSCGSCGACDRGFSVTDLPGPRCAVCEAWLHADCIDRETTRTVIVNGDLRYPIKEERPFRCLRCTAKAKADEAAAADRQREHEQATANREQAAKQALPNAVGTFLATREDPSVVRFTTMEDPFESRRSRRDKRSIEANPPIGRFLYWATRKGDSPVYELSGWRIGCGNIWIGDYPQLWLTADGKIVGLFRGHSYVSTAHDKDGKALLCLSFVRQSIAELVGSQLHGRNWTAVELLEAIQ